MHKIKGERCNKVKGAKFCQSKIQLLKYRVTQRLKIHMETGPSKQSFKIL